MAKASAQIAAGIVLAAAKRVREESDVAISDARGKWLERALTTPVRRGRLWWARDHYRTEAECLAEYVAPRGFAGSIEYAHRMLADRRIDWADEYIALAKASLTMGDGFVRLTAEDVQFLGLEKEAS